MSEEERELSLAIITSEHPIDFEPKQFPTEVKMIEAYQLWQDWLNTNKTAAVHTKSEKWKSLMEVPAFSRYIRQCEKIDDENHSNYLWLKKCGKLLKEQKLYNQMRVIAQLVIRYNNMIRPKCCIDTTETYGIKAESARKAKERARQGEEAINA